MKSKVPLAMIVNPNAGRKIGRQTAKNAAARLNDAGLSVQMFISEKPGDTLSIAQSLEQTDWSGVIVVGGDGSLFEVLNGLCSDKSVISIPIGQIPVGTGNSYIRDLGISSVDVAVQSIIAGECRLVDLGWFTCDSVHYHFINLLGVGFVSNVARRSARYKLFGTRSYVFGIIEEIIHLDPVPIRLQVDDEIIERRAIFVEICNSRYTGGNMLIAPSAKIDDGLLDVVVMKETTRFRALKLLPTIFTGAHLETPEFEVFRGHHIKLESERPMALTPDGENFGSTPIEASTDSKAFQFFKA